MAKEAGVPGKCDDLTYGGYMTVMGDKAVLLATIAFFIWVLADSLSIFF